MIITTEKNILTLDFELGQKLFAMKNNKVIELEIKGILITIRKRGDNITKDITYVTNNGSYTKQLYKTKQELLETL